jgi:hypothetical protein
MAIMLGRRRAILLTVAIFIAEMARYEAIGPLTPLKWSSIRALGHYRDVNDQMLGSPVIK